MKREFGKHGNKAPRARSSGNWSAGGHQTAGYCLYISGQTYSPTQTTADHVYGFFNIDVPLAAFSIYGPKTSGRNGLSIPTAINKAGGAVKEAKEASDKEIGDNHMGDGKKTGSGGKPIPPRKIRTSEVITDPNIESVKDSTGAYIKVSLGDNLIRTRVEGSFQNMYYEKK